MRDEREKNDRLDQLMDKIQQSNEINWKEPKGYFDYNGGDIVRLKDGRLFLVGDVNELMGCCDDCKDFDSKDIAAYTSILNLLTENFATQ